MYKLINNNSKGEIDLNCFFMNGSMFDINSMFSSSRAKNLKKIYFISQWNLFCQKVKNCRLMKITFTLLWNLLSIVLVVISNSSFSPYGWNILHVSYSQKIQNEMNWVQALQTSIIVYIYVRLNFKKILSGSIHYTLTLVFIFHRKRFYHRSGTADRFFVSQENVLTC